MRDAMSYHIPPKKLAPARAGTLPDYVIQAGGRGQARHLTQFST